MDSQSNIPTAGEMLGYVAELVAGGLPCPMDIGLADERQGFRHRYLELRAPDNNLSDVDAWARHFETSATVGRTLFNPKGERPWRVYSFERADLRGWDVKVWTVRTEPAEETGS